MQHRFIEERLSRRVPFTRSERTDCQLVKVNFVRHTTTAGGDLRCEFQNQTERGNEGYAVSLRDEETSAGKFWEK